MIENLRAPTLAELRARSAFVWPRYYRAYDDAERREALLNEVKAYDREHRFRLVGGELLVEKS